MPVAALQRKPAKVVKVRWRKPMTKIPSSDAACAIAPNWFPGDGPRL